LNCVHWGGVLSEGSTGGQTGGQAKENLFLSGFPNAHLWELPGEPEPQTPFAVSPITRMQSPMAAVLLRCP